MEIISILAPGFSFFLALKLRFRLESLLKSAGQEQLLRMLSGWEDKVIITTCTTLSQELHHQHHYNSQGNYSVLKNPIPPVDLQQWIGKMFGKMTFFLSSKGGWIHSRKWVSKSTLMMMMILSVRFVPLGTVWCLLVEIWPARCKMGEAGLPTRGRGGVGYILSGNMILAVASRDERHFFLLFFQSEGGGSLSEYPGLDVCCVDHHPSLAGPRLVPGQLRPANKSRLAPQKSLDLFKTPIIFRLSCKSACLAGAWVLIVSL